MAGVQLGYSTESEALSDTTIHGDGPTDREAAHGQQQPLDIDDNTEKDADTNTNKA
ncbi:hypothetical protein GBF38_005033 [Nibea albiflora]|uniref:Uncharacterized protein n=1 Tax=Nibea albiflora TaxID=240163 RepID=A0ACB7EW98_NIBAL|nr:hypothetical protein GBF38_005033 [Nibea albiflora]